MKRIHWLTLCLTLLAAPVFVSAGAETFTLKRTDNVMKTLGWRVFQDLKLTDERPASIKRVPAGLKNPLFGQWILGPVESPARFDVIFDSPPGKPARLFVAVSGDGVFADSPLATWKAEAYRGTNGEALYSYTGSVDLNVSYGGEHEVYRLGLMMFDPRDTFHSLLSDTILYYRDTARSGEITLGGTAYHAMLTDERSTGDFRSRGPTTVMLLLDVNGNGVFERQGEMFDVQLPFKIHGKAWEIASIAADGATINIVPSDKPVAEILPPLNLSPGHLAPAFTGMTYDGKTVRYPQDYKGKLVLLQFWATWCGRCHSRIEDWAAVYAEFHQGGVEMVGVSLDPKGAESAIAETTRTYRMPWPQIYDGKYWSADVARLYNTSSLPTCYLLDADTSKVLAVISDPTRENLRAAVQNAKRHAALDRKK